VGRSLARNHHIPIEWPRKTSRTKITFGPTASAWNEASGSASTLSSEHGTGPHFRSLAPKYPTDDPDYRIILRKRSRFTHYYFYIRDEALGPMVMCVGSFLPFQTRY